ncbi:hypothetical protein [Kitasatospora sp. NPDC093806]|uniref:hypothetical protein n=1 Tax=Kitasatospora sp. NPDC093806 TaxID=3155075 RepID=UPI00341E1B59
MTFIQHEPENDPGIDYQQRTFRACTCGTDCKPDAHVTITQPYLDGEPRKSLAAPLKDPHRPDVGRLTLDTLTGRLGVLMDKGKGNAVFLRQEGGGYEWETDRRFIHGTPRRR